MSDIVIQVTDLSKRYRLGVVGTGTLAHDLNRWWAKVRGRPDPTLPVGQEALNSRPSAARGQSPPSVDGTPSGAQHRGSDYVWALKDLSFEVHQGEVLGIIGRNGAGKSTLLKILSRVTAPTSGEARIRGRVASLLEVGTGFHPELTGRENVALNGALLGMRKREIALKFDEIVAFSGPEVEQYIDTPVKRYSSGMYVRLAFAVAAHLETEIMIVDEVLAVGDTAFQKKCLGKMGAMGHEGRTVLVVSHNMPSIVNLCERAILLSDGRAIADGQASEVVQQYLATAVSAGGEVVWPDPDQAPGNDIVRLHAVRILQDGIDGPTEDVSISKEVLVQIQYWNFREGSLLYPAIMLMDRMGTFVLASNNHRSVSLTEDPWSGRPHPIGLFQSVCRIPRDFLNESLYTITAIVGKGTSDTQILEDSVLSFDVHDTGAMRKEYYGAWAGVVRPKLAWSTEMISSVNQFPDS
jgi:lipopolysaccharide transport system ATP-binding protein